MSDQFNPNAAASPDAGIYGLPHSFDQASVVFIPVPWEATTSYGGGTAFGPDAILAASSQLDLFDLDVERPYECGMHLLPIDSDIISMNKRAHALAQPIKEAGGEIGENTLLHKNLKEVNHASEQLNAWVKRNVARVLAAGKIPAIVGGDHSVPFGAFQAAAEKGSFGILHFDAHSDTRHAYMGFQHSHASIMRNALDQIPEVETLVQVGIRDFCEEEYEFASEQNDRVEIFFDQHIKQAILDGDTFNSIAMKMVNLLPQKVWVSFDIDGLDPRYCPHTGTPVPGGLDYSEAIQILNLLARSGRTIIGFDVVEVAPPLDSTGNPIEPLQASDEWDANVGMRLLYKLAAFALASQGKAKWRNL